MNSRRRFLKSAIAGAGLGLATSISAESASDSSAAKKVDRRVLGRLNKEVSILGLGLGSAFTKPRHDKPESAQAILKKALEHGINYWDTSRGYEGSEALMGPVVEKRRDEIFLVTKSGARDYDGFMRDVETSLQKLRTDRFDLLHMWNLPADANLDEMESGCFKAVQKLKDEKVIGGYGVTGHSGARILMDAMERFDPDAVLTVFPCTRDDDGRYEDELLPLARERNMGVIAMKTVRRARNADLVGSDLIRYALSLKGISTTIVGLDTEAHLTENVEMATGFQAMAQADRERLHRDAVTALAGIPTPWEQPGYHDGAIV